MLTAKTTVGADGRHSSVWRRSLTRLVGPARLQVQSISMPRTFTRYLPSFQNVYCGGRLWQFNFVHKSQHQIPQSVKLYKITRTNLFALRLGGTLDKNVRDFDDCGPWLKIIGTAPSFSNRRHRRIDGFCPIKR